MIEQKNHVLIVFAQKDELWNTLRTKSSMDHILYVSRGNVYARISKERYQLDVTNIPQLEQFFQEIVTNTYDPISIVYEGKKHREIESEEDALELFDSSVWATTAILQAMLHTGMKYFDKFLYLYQTSLNDQYGHRAMTGYGNTVKIEFPKLDFKVIQLVEDDGILADYVDVIDTELKSEAIETEVRYSGMKRYVRKLVQMESAKAKQIDTEKQLQKMFPENGVCLISGGTGGLGLIFARYLLTTFHATVIVTGRSRMNETIHAKLKELDHLGGRIEYIQCDVSSKAEVANLVEYVDKHFGKIHGVIHAAGCVHDGMIATKKKEDMLAVIRPKMLGVLWLEQLTRHEGLVFFVTCSSISGVLGNVGQSDYAYGNCFMDSYVLYCRSLHRSEQERFLSINWPYWKDGGMVVEEETKEMFRRVFGMEGMDSKNGIRTINYAIAENLSNFIVIEGNPEQIKKGFGIHFNDKYDQKMLQGNNVMKSRNQAMDFTKIVQSMVSEVQKIVEEELDPNENLSEFGFDSIYYTKLSKRINQTYNLNITPSLFFEYTTIQMIADYLKSVVKEQGEYIQAEEEISQEAPIQQTEDVRKVVRLAVAEVIKLDDDDLEDDINLSEFGFDSITFTKLCNFFQKKYSLELSPSIFFEYTTIDELAGFFQSEYPNAFGHIHYVNKENERKENNDIKGNQINILEKRSDIMDGPKNILSSVDSYYHGDEVAIIGMSGKMPMSDNLDEFWTHLLNGDDLIGGVPKNRPTDQEMDQIQGGFVNDIDTFDPLFFHLSPMEAELMDPQQRLFLETVWHVIEDAGYKASNLSGTDTGIFAGVVTSDYNDIIKKSGEEMKLQTSTGISHAVLVNRISYFLNLKGPSEPYDTACSSSLLAIHRAVEAIHSGECSMAIAGGVNAILTPTYNIAFSKAGMLSKDSRCKTFSEEADGYVRSEAVGAVFLKPLKQAIKDKDHIYAVIRGSAVNHNGRSNALTAPSTKAQVDVIEKAWLKANVSPNTISYIEAHGTGTKLGDPIEIDALRKAFDGLSTKTNTVTLNQEFCSIGALKSNMGHAEAAAGIAGLLKVLLAMKYHKIPKNLHCEHRNPYIQLEGSPFYLSSKQETWQGFYDETLGRYVRRAGISAFGYGGVNVHLALEDYQMESMIESEQMPELIVLSAQTNQQLKRYAQDLLNALISNSQITLKQIAFTLQCGRESITKRVAWIVSSKEEFMCTLENYINDRVDGSQLREDNTLTSKQEFPMKLSTDTDIREKQLQRAGEIWLASNADSFDSWYEQEIYRISLPGYPFEKERYWATAEQANSKDQSLSFNKEEQRAYFTEHKIQGEMIFPAAASIGTILNSVNWKQGRTISISEIGLMCKIPYEKIDSLHITNRGEQNNHYQIMMKGNGVDIEAVTATLAYHDESVTRFSFDMESLHKKLNHTLTKEMIYDKFTKAGMDYGNMFRCIETLHVSKGEALAYIRNREDHFTGSRIVLPSVLDGIFQSIVGMNMEEQSNSTYIPFYLEQMELYETIPESCYAYAKEVSGYEHHSDHLSYDITILAQKGTVIGKIHGLLIRKRSNDNEKKHIMENLDKDITMHTLTPSYEPIEVDSTASVATSPSFLFVSERSLQNELLKDHQTIELLWEGKDYESLKKEIVRNIENGYVTFVIPVIEEENIATEFEITQPFQAIYRFAKLAGDMAQQIKAVFMYYVLDIKQQVLATSLQGFMESMVKEGIYSDYTILGVDDPSYTNMAIWESEKAKEKTKDENQCYQLENQRLSHLTLHPIVKDINVKEAKGFRQNGTYLLTGGMGGIGVRFSQYLIDTYHVNLIVLGRKNIELHYKNILYKVADLTDKTSTIRAVREAQDQMGPIHGVIHMAGVLDDGLFLGKTEQDIIRIVEPKLNGIKFIEEALVGCNLDFVLLFASTTAYYGNMGQAGYAYANGCLDAYARYRDYLQQQGKVSGRTKVFDWSYWLHGGMQISDHELEQLESQTGIVPIEEGRAYQVIEESFSDNVVSRIVYATKNKTNIVKESNYLALMTKFIKEIVSRITKIAPKRINPKADMEQYGMDSVMTLNTIRELEVTFGVLPKTLTFEYQSIETLAGYFVKEHMSKVMELFQQSDRDHEIIVENTISHNEKQENKELQSFYDKDNKNDHDNKDSNDDEIAIIGISGVYPGANDLQKFWENLKVGKDCITEVPKERFNMEQYFSTQKRAPGKTNCRFGGFIDGVDKFDPLFFHISPREAKIMDPQERLFLENVWHTMENAGYTRTKLSTYNTGVFVGVMYGQYQMYGSEESVIKKGMIPESSYASIANRVSYFYDLKGPSMAVDTMCSSSITAIHLACNSIRNGECDMAFAGGINLSIHPHKYLSLSQGGFLADDGRCRAFGADGTGYVPGEGVGSILLKTLSKAKHDGDYIYAIIRGSSLNHGGKTNGYSVPNPSSQADVIGIALENTKVDINRISYIEAHGTGTSLGDPIEIQGLSKAIGTTKREKIAVGSVKSNIGHLESAAGIASISKVVLEMCHKSLVPSIHSDVLNENLDLEHTPFVIQHSYEPWKVSESEKRVAGISAFGAGGSNSHLILEEYQMPMSGMQQEKVQLVVLSADNKDRLQELIDRFANFLAAYDENGTLLAGRDLLLAKISLDDLVYTLQTGREALRYRIAFVVESFAQFKERIQQLVQQEDMEWVVRSEGVTEYTQAVEDMSVYQGSDHQYNWNRIAKDWVNGTDMLWNQCYSSQMQVIPLFEYPFAQDLCWIPLEHTKNEIEPHTEQKHEVNEKHTESFLGTLKIERSIGSGLVFKKEFHAEDEKLKSHMVVGEKIVPAAFYVELCAQLAKQIQQSSNVVLNQISFRAPCVIGNETKEIELHVSNDLDIEIVSSEGTVYCKGSIADNKRLVKQKVNRLELERHFTKKMSKQQVYDIFESCGLEYGNYNQLIETLYYENGTEALAHIQLPEQYKSEVKEYVLHPSILDGALQSILGIMMAQNDQTSALLPFYIQKIEVIQELPSEVYAYVKEQEEQSYHIAIIDTNGVICAKLLGVEVKKSSIQKKEAQVQLKEGLYQEEIRLMREFDCNRMLRNANNVVIIYSRDQEMMKDELLEQYPTAEYILLEDNKTIEDKIKSFDMVDRVYFLAGIDHTINDMKVLSDQIDSGVMKLNYIVKLLAERFLTKPLELIAVTNSVPGIDGIGHNYADAGIHGYVKSLAKEFRRWRVTYVTLTQTVDSKKAVLGILAPPYNERGDGAIWDGEAYKVSCYQSCNDLFTDYQMDYSGTVWVIVGGTGGIGLVLAEHVTKSHAKKVVLLGRRPEESLNTHVLEVIKQANGVIEYMQADISDYKRMQNVAKYLKENDHKVNYVVHSAIVLEDKGILNMSEEAFRRVVTPKAEGSFALCESMKELTPDSFIFFSSAQSITGNAGQSNYATGCCIKDAYARHLRTEGFDAKVIRWGYWGSVGKVASMEYQKVMEDNEISSIQPEEGMAVVDGMIKYCMDEVIYIKATQKVLKAIGMIEEEDSFIRNEKSTLRLLATIPEMVKIMFIENGLYTKVSDAYTKNELMKRLQVTNSHEKVFDEILCIMVRQGYLRQEGNDYVYTAQMEQTVTRDEMEQRVQTLAMEYPEIKAHVDLLWECTKNLLPILSDHQKATNIIFPKSSMDLIDGTYKGNPVVDIFNDSVAEACERILVKRPGEKILILEIGAGTGGTSQAVLEQLAPYGNRITYCYTDISNSFLQYGKKEYGVKYPFMEFKRFNVEQDPLSQGFGEEYDIVIAANVLHATKNMSVTLQHVASILKPQGSILINEVTRKDDNLTLTYGLLDGWWLFEDEQVRITGSPLLDVEHWKSVLYQNHFGQVTVVSDERQETKKLSQSVILATVVKDQNPKVTVAEEKVVIENPMQTKEPVKSKIEKTTDTEHQILDFVYQVIDRCIVTALEVNNDAIDRKRAFSEYGVDSITGLELVTQINDTFDIKMKTTIVFDYSNVELLGNHIFEKYRDKVSELFQSRRG